MASVPQANNKVEHPAHYTQGGIECIDAMEAAFGPLAVYHYLICSSFKYLWRHELKDDPKIDLEKSANCARMAEKRRERAFK